MLLAPLRRRPTTFYDCAQVQNKWIPLGLGLLFGIFVVLALVATALLLARRVRTGSFFLTLLWFWTALYFFAGTGGLVNRFSAYSPALQRFFPEQLWFWAALLILVRWHRRQTTAA